MVCISCGAEMRLVRVEPAETMMVTGYEYHTFECSSCQEVERRLTFTREPTCVPVDTASPVSLSSMGQNESALSVSPASTDQDEAAPSVSPASMGEDEAAASVSPASTDQDEAAPSVSPASMGEDEAAASVAPASTDQDEAAPSASSASMGQNEAAASVAPASTDQGAAAPPTEPSAPSRWARAVGTLTADEPRLTDKQGSEAYRSWADLPRHRHSPLSPMPLQTPSQAFLNLISHEDPGQPVAPPSAWARLVAKLRGRQDRGS
jgi:hypothetical protein